MYLVFDSIIELRCNFKSIFIVLFIFLTACSTKKNTEISRLYHSINTKYNIYFNAEEAYKETLKLKQDAYEDNLSRLLSVYPVETAKEGSESEKKGGGAFTKTVDKTTKAIKLHSIKAKPKPDPKKRRDPEYQLWLQQQEFNPFLKNAWLLLGKAEFEDGDYLKAASTFSYITRLYKGNAEVVAEARLWMARSYATMGWFYEAEDNFHKLELAGGVPQSLQYDYAKIYADYLIRRQDFDAAIPYLEKAIQGESDSKQKTRMRYLLGQLYSKQGNRAMAYEAFQKLQGLSTPYEYSFNAIMQQAALADNSGKKNVLDKLNSMAKGSKNKDYKDQIFSAIGNIYLNDGDTIKAIESYRKAIKESTRNSYDKAVTQVILGDIYFRQRNFVEAQACYSEAFGQLDKSHEDYELVSLRSSVLDELVDYVKAVHLQDSLQLLARMPEPERLAVIDKIITEIQEEDKKEKEQAEKGNRTEDNLSTQNPLFESTTPNIPVGPVVTGGDGKFYFYSPQQVNQGKTAFQRKWGNRKLEDNWRRRNKQLNVFDTGQPDESLNSDDSANRGNDIIPEQGQQGDSKGIVADKYSPEFYLKQIPLTPEALKASNKIIEDAYFNMGLIYKDKLGDYSLAIDAFETDLRRFPDTPNLEEIYYQLFLIYLKLADANMVTLYRGKLLESFPNGNYAASLADANYEWNLRNMHKYEDDFYQETYSSYLASKVNTVRENYQSMKKRFPLSNLLPKFMFLNAMTYAQTNQPTEFEKHLSELIKKYPKADVTEVATEMLKGLKEGKALAADSSPARGMIWNIKFSESNKEEGEAAPGVDFTVNADSEYVLLLIFKSNAVDKNQLIYSVANYNFSKFVYQTFDLSFSEVAGLEILQVKGFKSFKDITEYINLAFEKNSLMDQIDPSVIPVPISVDNFIALMNGKTLNEYFVFFEQNHTKEMLKLVNYWNIQRERMIEEVREESSVVPETVKPEEVASVPPLVNPAMPVPITPEKVEPQKDDKTNIEVGVGDVIPDETLEKADDIINKAKDIIDNPVEGLKNLFKSKESNDEGLTKEEKDQIKADKKKQKEEEQRLINEQKAKEKAEREQIEAQEKAKQDALKKAETDRANAAKNAKKAKEEAEKKRKDEIKQREKDRKELLKKREADRKEALRKREAEKKELLKKRENK